jgi:hypothetical protein
MRSISREVDVSINVVTKHCWTREMRAPICMMPKCAT